MLIDCATCPASPERAARFHGRGPDHCSDCVVTVMGLLPPVPMALGAIDCQWSDETSSGANRSNETSSNETWSGEEVAPWPEVVDLDLDEAEWAAVGLFVRAGMITRQSARLLRAFADEPERRTVAPPGLTG